MNLFVSLDFFMSCSGLAWALFVYVCVGGGFLKKMMD